MLLPSYVWEKLVNFSENFERWGKEKKKNPVDVPVRAVPQSGFVSSHLELMTRFVGLVSIRLYCSQTAATLLIRDLIYQVSKLVLICHGPHHINIGLVTLWYLLQQSVYLLTFSLTPWSRSLLEKLTGSQLVKKFPAFYGTRRSIQSMSPPPQSPIPFHEDPSWYPPIHT